MYAMSVLRLFFLRHGTNRDCGTKSGQAADKIPISPLVSSDFALLQRIVYRDAGRGTFSARITYLQEVV